MAVSVAFLAACPRSEPRLEYDASACTEEHKDVPVAISRDIDILFVVDTSPSMAGEAGRLAYNLPRFGNVLENIEGGLPNVHIGVVSADVAARGGRLESAARISGCAPPSGAFLEDIAYANGERDANYTGDFVDALTCIAALPADGGEIAQPLEAMKRALDGSNPGNAGFLRENAFLFVAFIGDEDDCSGGAAFDLADSEAHAGWRCFDDGVVCNEDTATPGTKTGCVARETPDTLEPIDSYVDFLKGLKPDPGMVVVAAVANAPTAPVVSTTADGPVLDAACTSDTAESRPAVRMHSFLDQFPQRHVSTPTCAEDWSDALVIIAELQASVGGPACFEGDIDVDPETEGVQVECVISQVQNWGRDDQVETVLPECSSGDPPDTERPCWIIEADPIYCPDTATQASLEILRGRESVLPGTMITARCFSGCTNL